MKLKKLNKEYFPLFLTITLLIAYLSSGFEIVINENETGHHLTIIMFIMGIILSLSQIIEGEAFIHCLFIGIILAFLYSVIAQINITKTENVIELKLSNS